jgi:predicted translin family RNA/ssDNA-binding protein
MSKKRDARVAAALEAQIVAPAVQPSVLVEETSTDAVTPAEGEPAKEPSAPAVTAEETPAVEVEAAVPTPEPTNTDPRDQAISELRSEVAELAKTVAELTAERNEMRETFQCLKAYPTIWKESETRLSAAIRTSLDLAERECRKLRDEIFGINIPEISKRLSEETKRESVNALNSLVNGKLAAFDRRITAFEGSVEPIKNRLGQLEEILEAQLGTTCHWVEIILQSGIIGRMEELDRSGAFKWLTAKFGQALEAARKQREVAAAAETTPAETASETPAETTTDPTS